MAESGLSYGLKPTGGLFASPEDDTKKLALEKIKAALDARENRMFDPQLLAIAQGLLSPTKTGSFGESLGQAAGNVLPVMQAEEKANMENAQIRLQVAQSEVEQANKLKALSMAANAMGLTPEALQQGLQQGTIAPNQISKINSGLYMAISAVDPKIGEALKNAYQMDVENAKIAVDLYGKGVQKAELEAKYGKGILELLPPAPLSGGAKPPAATGAAPAAPAPAAKVEVSENLTPEQKQTMVILNQEMQRAQDRLASATDDAQRARAQGDIDGIKREMNLVSKSVSAKPISAGTSAAPSAAPSTTPREIAAIPKGEVVSEAVKDDLAWLPIETQNKIRAERQKEIDTPYSEKRKAIMAFDPQYVSTSNSRLKELYQIANDHPEIFGLMQEKGFFNALGAAAQQGSQTPWGTWSLPVRTFMEKMKLSPEQQTIASRASQLLAEQFFENAKTNKSVLGPSISNADVLLLKAPVATAEDSSEAIKYWVKQNRLANAQKLDLYDALNQFDTRHGAKAAPGAFFSSSNPSYGGITKKYETLTDQLVRSHSPSWISKPKEKQ